MEETKEKNYEFNSFRSGLNFDCMIDVFHNYTPEDIRNILADPMGNNEEIRKLSRLAYNTNPIASNAIDYMVALPCLDYALTSKGKAKTKVKKNKEIVEKVLDKIKHKELIRDFLFRDCIDGASYYYFESSTNTLDNRKFIDDFEMTSILELNSIDEDINYSVIPLPTDYTKIRGYKNNRPVIAFNLEYFNQFTGEGIVTRLRKFPIEIQEAWDKWDKGNTVGNWVVLNNEKTMVHKIKSNKREPFGRPITMGALIDIFYNDFLTNTKRNILNEVNNQFIYQTLPEGEKGKCSLTSNQQQDQHKAVKEAVLTKNSRGGKSFVTVAAGTKIESIDTSVALLDEDIEPKLNSKIALGMGIALGILDGEAGSYSSQQINLELLFSKIYSWVSEIAYEINYVINKNVLKDDKNAIDIYYLPTSLTNKEKFVSMCKDIYMAGSGSKSMWISSTGMNLEAYLSLMNKEIDEKWDEKYKPHLTSFTARDSGDKPNPDGNLGGRPEIDNPTDESTLATKSNNSNNQPKPSTN